MLIIIGALTLVLVATVFWGFTGTLPINLTVTGCVVDAKAFMGDENEQDETLGIRPDEPLVVCFVDSSKYSSQQIAKFDPSVTVAMPDHTHFAGNIIYVSPVPISRDEGRDFIKGSEWVAEQCVSSDYSWGLVVRVDGNVSDHLYTTNQVTMITDEVSPIRFLTR